MVTIKGFKERKTKEGETFLVLELEGGPTAVKSQQTGRMYFTTKKCTVPATFDEETCQSLIGQTFPGEIVKVKCDPYSFTIEDTGEIIELDYRWEYLDKSLDLVPENIIEESAVM
ncbi:hypothetical protein [Aestuariivivens sediminis]|uniref:hypothetical protein n=1 Tax=Aestuariivivens sediminis TaxID=2913557 RepID=UPI001F59A9B9|nr:hypothetical protein [Aestuariivivens sediminis]